VKDRQHVFVGDARLLRQPSQFFRLLPGGLQPRQQFGLLLAKIFLLQRRTLWTVWSRLFHCLFLSFNVWRRNRYASKEAADL
jgi:hypothetical protein